MEDKLLTLVLPEWLGRLFFHHDPPPEDTDTDSLQRRIAELTTLAGVQEAVIILQGVGLQVDVIFENPLEEFDQDLDIE